MRSLDTKIGGGLFALFSLFLNSCNFKSNEKSVSLLENLDISTNTIIDQSGYLYGTLEYKLSDAAPDSKIKYLYPKVEVIKSITKKVYEQLESSLQDFPISENAPKANELYNTLKLYKETLLDVDIEFTKDNARQIFNFLKADAATSDSKEEFLKLLSKSSKDDYILILSKLKNDAAILENKFLIYSNIQSLPNNRIIFDAFASIVSQNTKHLNQGDTLEIYTGIGNFSTFSNPSIIIDGSSVKVGRNGLSTYQFRVKGEIGLHVMPVFIQYTNTDGSKNSQKVPVTYYIDK